MIFTKKCSRKNVKNMYFLTKGFYPTPPRKKDRVFLSCNPISAEGVEPRSMYCARSVRFRCLLNGWSRFRVPNFINNLNVSRDFSYSRFYSIFSRFSRFSRFFEIFDGFPKKWSHIMTNRRRCMQNDRKFLILSFVFGFCNLLSLW